VTWFIDGHKIPNDDSLEVGDTVSFLWPGDITEVLDGFSAKKVLIDPASTPEWVRRRLEEAGATVVKGRDPCQLPKARKNETELEGARAAHRRDGLALCRFLSWLEDRTGEAGAGPGELELCDKLLNFRREMPLFQEVSFDTIAGSGPNGAIVHYRATPESARRLQPGELFLLDSGGQYLDGTTDVTRTVVSGEPTEEMRCCFTLVLKDHIAIARARFPKGTTGSQLDSLARYPLWLEGRDYDHGTGHGVGSYLGVHEGPQRVSKVPNSVPLEPGMIVSNEPGYYKEGAFGIRIENLVAVTESESPENGDRPMLGFETLTLAPIDLRLVESERLTAEERDWLNAYHARVRDAHAGHLDEGERAWLEAAARPI
jgi:Xaa-Pro aminopeptidase